MTIFRVDVQICGTAYIKAASRKEADLLLAKFIERHGVDVELSIGSHRVSDLPFDHPGLPEISLSPAITIIGVFPGADFEET